ncbi:MAG: hypothetical protein HY735_06300 [Verrucomicrobia bacterium]|nr:hypothetical protein [Verrucomicrobiota bacterium]
MKTLSVREAQPQLDRLLVEAARGDLIVLTDGDIQVRLAPFGVGHALDPEADTPELEAELLKAVRGPHSPFSEAELHEIAGRAVQEHRTQRGQ